MSKVTVLLYIIHIFCCFVDLHTHNLFIHAIHSIPFILLICSHSPLSLWIHNTKTLSRFWPQQNIMCVYARVHNVNGLWWVNKWKQKPNESKEWKKNKNKRKSWTETQFEECNEWWFHLFRKNNANRKTDG